MQPYSGAANACYNTLLQVQHALRSATASRLEHWTLTCSQHTPALTGSGGDRDSRTSKRQQLVRKDGGHHELCVSPISAAVCQSSRHCHRLRTYITSECWANRLMAGNEQWHSHGICSSGSGPPSLMDPGLPALQSCSWPLLLYPFLGGRYTTRVVLWRAVTMACTHCAYGLRLRPDSTAAQQTLTSTRGPGVGH